MITKVIQSHTGVLVFNINERGGFIISVITIRNEHVFVTFFLTTRTFSAARNMNGNTKRQLKFPSPSRDLETTEMNHNTPAVCDKLVRSLVAQTTSKQATKEGPISKLI